MSEGTIGNAKRESEVLSQLINQERLLCRLNDVVSSLESKIQIILRTDMISEPKVDSKEASLVPLAKTLKDNNDRVYSTIEQLEQLIERCEI